MMFRGLKGEYEVIKIENKKIETSVHETESGCDVKWIRC